MAKEQPAWVIVQGDTTTAFTAALTGYYADVKVAHVEAGLRSFDLRNPFPEEVNRRLIFSSRKREFCANRNSSEAPIAEGVTHH